MRVVAVLALLGLALAPADLAVAKNKGDDARQHLLGSVRYLRHRKPPPPVRADQNALKSVSTHWITQLLDHFDPTVNSTWEQRYFANAALYQEDGPIFIFIEGESEAQSGWIDEGGSYMYQMAELFKAKMYILEHRFFGQSQPTPDIRTSNLKWLTSDQALADLAYFIEYITERGEMRKGQKLAVFGGSYPGNLAAWARLKYPHLIHAAVASSAPVHAKENFKEYFEVVTRSIRTLSGEVCANNLERAFKRIKKLLMTDDGITQIQNLFYMCDPPSLDNKLDMDLFFEAMSNPFALATQYNRDDAGDAYSLKAQCANLGGSDLSDDEVVAKLADIIISSFGFIWDCVDWDYDDNTQGLRSIYYGGGDRQWVYMTCTTFGYFQTPDGDTVFPKGYYGVDYFIKQCNDAFGSEYDDLMAQSGVNRTNIMFGDWTPDVTNVLFVNGEIDPWHALGVLDDVNESSPAILISSTSHCYDMYPDEATDSDELRQARKRVKEFLTNALYNIPDGNNPTLAP